MDSTASPAAWPRPCLESSPNSAPHSPQQMYLGAHWGPREVEHVFLTWIFSELVVLVVALIPLICSQSLLRNPLQQGPC